MRMNSFFDKIYQKLFQPPPNPNVPFIEEALVRSESYRNAYFKRLNEGALNHEIERIRKAYILHQENLSADIQVHVLNSAGSNGLAIDYDASFGETDFSYLFDLLNDKVKNLGYRHQTSHRVVYLKKNYTKTLEKHYLKPPISYETDTETDIVKYNQQYGNVLIEYILKNDKPARIRLLVNYYSGFHYTEPLPFEELILQILGGN